MLLSGTSTPLHAVAIACITALAVACAACAVLAATWLAALRRVRASVARRAAFVRRVHTIVSGPRMDRCLRAIATLQGHVRSVLVFTRFQRSLVVRAMYAAEAERRVLASATHGLVIGVLGVCLALVYNYGECTGAMGLLHWVCRQCLCRVCKEPGVVRGCLSSVWKPVAAMCDQWLSAL